MASPTLPPEALLAPTQAGIARATQLLAEGRLIVLPTETVYGIAVNLNILAARTAARQLKARLLGDNTALPPWVPHVGRPEDIFSWAPHISSLARRLITKALPGPVAFQIRLGDQDLTAAKARLADAADETLVEGCLTVRCPDLPVTQQVLGQIPSAVAIIGAGTPSQPGIFEPAELPAAVWARSDSGGIGVHAVLDAGAARYRRSSTLVRVEGDTYKVVRQGVIDERIIHRLADFTILFLCSGNTCRSPMAAAIASRLLADKLGVRPDELHLRHIVIQSAGLHAVRGMRATLDAMEAAREHQTDLNGHVSQPATTELLRRADVIYTMTSAHREEALDLLPGAGAKIFRLDAEADIADPVGAGLDVYRQVARRLATVLRTRLAEWTL